MSRFVDLLKQIPQDNEEIPDVLLKKLDIAACNLVNSQAGQYDLTEEERREYAAYESPEVNDRKQKWGLLDKWPLQLGSLAVFKEKTPNLWYLGICFGSNPYVVLEGGSKEEIFEKKKQLNEYRETEGEEAFEEEIMRLRNLNFKILDNYERGD